MGFPLIRRRPTGAPVVLVGDDDAFTRHLASLIDRSGHPCRVAPTAAEALTLAAAPVTPVLVLDLSSSKMQSVEVALALRNRRYAPPVVAISSMPNVAQHCAALGIKHGLGQPFALGDLLDLLRKLAPEAPAAPPLRAASARETHAPR